MQGHHSEQWFIELYEQQTSDRRLEPMAEIFDWVTWGQVWCNCTNASEHTIAKSANLSTLEIEHGTYWSANKNPIPLKNDTTCCIVECLNLSRLIISTKTFMVTMCTYLYKRGQFRTSQSSVTVTLRPLANYQYSGLILSNRVADFAYSQSCNVISRCCDVVGQK